MKWTAQILILPLVLSGISQALAAEDKSSEERAAYEAKLKAMPRQNTAHPEEKPARYTPSIQQMKTPIELPGIPTVPGTTQYVSGQKQELEKETIYSVVYRVAMPASDLVDWYHNCLPMYKWNIQNKTSCAIIAKNSHGDRATISVSPVGANPLPKYKSTLTIYLRQQK